MTRTLVGRFGVILALLLSIGLTPRSFAATTLTAGDIAIIGYITNGSPNDSVSFVNLVPLDANTEIFFTDNGWTGSGFRGVTASDANGNEDLIRFTANAAIPVGTVIRTDDSSPNFTWTISGAIGAGGNYAPLALAQTGDQIAAVQGGPTVGNPLLSGFTPVFQVDNTGTFEPATSSATGDVVPPLSAASNTAVQLNNTATYAAFNLNTLASGTRADWLAAINNPGNWTFSSATSLPTGTINVGPTTGPQPITPLCPPTLSATSGTAASTNISATDADSTVNSAAITSAAVPGITLDAVTPASGPATNLTATLNVAATTAVGIYSVTITFGNDASQSATCVVNVSVSSTTSQRIRDIQGARQTSPLVPTVSDVGSSIGQIAQNVPGIVTVVRNNGFYMQDPNPDADPATSEGIFVFTGSAPGRQVGDAVTVNGPVSEFRTGCTNPATCTPTNSAWNNLTTTQIGAGGSGNAAGVTFVSAGNPLPAPTIIGSGGRVPPTAIIDNDTNGSVENPAQTTFDPATDGIDFYESLEGMRVQVNDAVAVSPTTGNGEIAVLSDNGAGAGPRTARGGILIGDDYTDFNPEIIIIDDVLVTAEPQVNVADRFPGAIVGVLDYSFGNFKLLNTQALPAVVSGGLTRETVSLPAVVTDTLSITSFNVENLGANEAQAKFDALAGIVVNNLGAPDIVGLEEIQDNNGSTNDGTVAADQTFAKLVAAISAAGGPTYSFAQIDPQNGTDGGQPGGNIRVGFLYRIDRGLTLVSRPGGTATSATSVVAGATGPELSQSPGRIDPTNAAFTDSRKPLAAEFRWNGRTVFAIVNHFNSKGGDQPLYGRFQPPQRSSEVQRLQQATIVNQFVGSILALDRNALVAVMGDINDFQFSPVANTLKANGALVGLLDTLPKNQRYTYNFNGNAQVLDQILASPGLNAALSGFDVVHVNSEFADQISDHDPSVARFTLGTPSYRTLLPFVWR